MRTASRPIARTRPEITPALRHLTPTQRKDVATELAALDGVNGNCREPFRIRSYVLALQG